MNTKVNLLSPVETAALLKVSVQTLACWRTNKLHNLKFIKVGSLVRYQQNDIDAWLNNRTQNKENTNV